MSKFLMGLLGLFVLMALNRTTIFTILKDAFTGIIRYMLPKRITAFIRRHAEFSTFRICGGSQYSSH